MSPEKLIFSFCIFLGISFPEKCLFIAKTMNMFLINGGISTWRPYLEKHYQEGSPRTGFAYIAMVMMWPSCHLETSLPRTHLIFSP